jgi:hypothetical protein
MRITSIAIGCMRGSMWAFGVGAFVSFVVAVWLRQGKFLWIALILELLIMPIWAMKIELEKGAKGNC